MRIAQIIDSLEAGGAERMAVNFANALRTRVEFSGLIATRAEGSLKNEVASSVNYTFLRKQKLLDFNAIKSLLLFVKKNKVEVIHAHSTSVYMAVIIKMFIPKMRVIWHDHYGNSDFLDQRQSRALRLILKFCSGAVVVNRKLEKWLKQDLGFKKTIYLPNFATIDTTVQKTRLYGVDNFRIICVANLREQKNHILLLQVATKIKQSHPKWSFHLIGKDFKDEYSVQLSNLITELNLHESVFIYGSCNDTAALIQKCDIAILSSKSEGLPVALLEYGMLAKPVLATAVGEIASIIKNGKNGYLAESENENEFYMKLVQLIENEQRGILGGELHNTIMAEYSEKLIIDMYLEWLSKL